MQYQEKVVQWEEKFVQFEGKVYSIRRATSWCVVGGESLHYLEFHICSASGESVLYQKGRICSLTV